MSASRVECKAIGENNLMKNYEIQCKVINTITKVKRNSP